MSGPEAIQILARLLDANCDFADTRFCTLSGDETVAIAYGIGALKAIFTPLHTPAVPGVSADEQGAERAHSVPTPELAFDSGSVAINQLRGQAAGPLSFSEVEEECC